MTPPGGGNDPDVARDDEQAQDPSETAGYGGAVEGVGADTPEQEQQHPHLEQARRDRADEGDPQAEDRSDEPRPGSSSTDELA